MANELEPYIPYKGNKFGIVDNIYSTIASLNIPRPLGIVDAFAGGGSFSYFMARKGFKIIANDIEEGVIELHRLIQRDWSSVQKFEEMPFDYDAFWAVRKEPTALGAFARAIWSFSNRGFTYYCAKDRQYEKLDEWAQGLGEPRERFRHIEDIRILYSRCPIQIDWRSGSFEDIEVPEGWLCYCDPPYRDTDKYISGQFDHDRFYAWALAQPGLVLISEYNMPEPFVLLDSYTKINDGGGNSKRKWCVEKLYANRPVQKLSLF